MHRQISQWIQQYVAEYPAAHRLENLWLEPIVAFAATSDPLFQQIRSWTHPHHLFPEDLLPEAKTVVAYYLPFQPKVSISNENGLLASPEWGSTYLLTNQLITRINDFLVLTLRQSGYLAAYAGATHNFDESSLMSPWSHRHAAYIAGLGSFGLHNLLITAQGCCGRLGTLVTSAPAEATPRPEREACLYRYNGSCGLCVSRCVNGSLHFEDYDRHLCYTMCLKNAQALDSMGLADVCGKCTVQLPCSLTNPVSETSPVYRPPSSLQS